MKALKSSESYKINIFRYNLDLEDNLLLYDIERSY